MKKVGLIFLVMVIALGALGIGYAMWSDTLVITGGVTTGTLDINITGYSGTKVFKDTGTGDLIWFTFDKVWNGPALISEWYGPEIDPTPVGQEIDDFLADHPEFIYVAMAYGDGVVVDGKITDAGWMEYFNLFPIENEEDFPGFCADIKGKYVGTVPVHLKTEIDFPEPYATGLEWLYWYEFVTITYDVWDASGTWLGTFDFDTSNPIQLHQNYTFEVNACITIPQTITEDGETFNTNDPEGHWQDLSGQIYSFIIKIMAYQWNEAPPASIP